MADVLIEDLIAADVLPHSVYLLKVLKRCFAVIQLAESCEYDAEAQLLEVLLLACKEVVRGDSYQVGYVVNVALPVQQKLFRLGDQGQVDVFGVLQ